MALYNKDVGDANKMTNNVQEKTTRTAPRNVLARIFAFWIDNRRLLLVAMIAVALFSFINSLTPTTRHALFIGFLAQRSLVALLLAFILIALSLLWSAGQQLDTWIFLMFNLRGYHPLWLDRVMWVFTQIGNGIAGLFLSILLYFAGYRRFGIEMLMGILSLWLIIEIIKAIVERARPFLAMEGIRVIGWRERGKSFPSGHTAQAFFMATLINRYFEFRTPFSELLFAAAGMVAFTRIYVGAHYPRDVIGGAMLGSVWGILIALVAVYLVTGQF